MPDGMQLDPDKLKVLDAALHLAFISIARPVRSGAGDAEEPARMLGTQLRDAVVRFRSRGRAWIRLDDGRIHPTRLHAAKHVFFCAEQAKHTAFAQVGMGIYLPGHDS